MRNLSKIGRIFYGVAIAEMGIQAIYYRKFPYMLIPPTHFSLPVLTVLTAISGTLLAVAGICIIVGFKVRPVSLLLGFLLVLVFCFYFLPYEFISNNYLHFGEWENAEKELTLCGGAFIVARNYSGNKEGFFIGFLAKLIPLGIFFYSIPIICFGIYHFLGPQDVADYTPSWVPFKMFWAYFCGAALIGSGIAIILKIKPAPIATLLGIMIFMWFAVLHVPRIVDSPSIYMGSEITSAVIALAYSGIAFVISWKPTAATSKF